MDQLSSAIALATFDRGSLVSLPGAFLPRLASRELGHGCALPGTLAQRRFEIGWPPVFIQEIAERFVCELLKIHHAVAAQQIERLPGRIVKLNTLAGHQLLLSRFPS